MKIGIIRDTFFTNEPRGLNVAIALQKEGFEVFVLCFGQKSEVEIYKQITLDRFYLNNKIKNKIYPLIETVPLYKIFWARKIKIFIQKYNIEILHVHDLYMIGAALLANKKYNLPVILDFHENYVAAIQTYNWATSPLGKIIAQPYKWAKLEKKYLKNTDKLIVTCPEFKEVLLRKYSYLKAEEIIIYLNVPNLEEFSSYHIIPNIIEKNSSFVLFYFGVMGERRGILTCFEALKILDQKKANIKLLLIGPVDKAIKSVFDQHLNDEKLKDKIIFHSWKDIQEIPSYLTMSDACVSPLLKNDHHDTTIANKIFQYMLFEKPIIVSDCRPQQRIIEEDHCGLVFKAGDAHDLAEKIIQLYKNPELNKKLGINGKRALLKKYNWQDVTQVVIDMYQEIKRTTNEKRIN